MSNSIPLDWLRTFPHQQAKQAVEALSETWKLLARRHQDGFNRTKKEPDLTLVLCSRVRDLHPRLLGNWSAEPVHVIVDPETLNIQSRTRTDIEYTWNDLDNWKIVFEFKKLKRTASSYKAYWGSDGLGRFVDGSYSLGDPVACMMGIIIDDYSQCVDPILQALGDSPEVQTNLKIQPSSNGSHLQRPSVLFPPAAAFDTIHLRPAASAPRQGSIHVAHFFLEFGYSPHSPQSRSKKNA